MPVSFTIPGRVGGKGRARAVARGKFVRLYTPEKTRSMEAMVRDFAAQAMRGHPLFDGPVRLTVFAFYHHPESWSKKRKASTLWVTGRPDVDNICKLLGDSMNGIVFRDDAQVASFHFDRVYRSQGPEEVIMTIEALN